MESLKTRLLRLEEEHARVLAIVSELKGRLERLSGPAPAGAGIEPSVPEAPRAAATQVPGAPALPVAVHPISPAPQPPKSAGSIRFSGSLRTDIDIDSRVPNQAQIPFYITSPSMSGTGSAVNFTMHPRLTRIGFDYTGARDTTGAPNVTGKLELDFLNGGSESRQIIRVRQAYMKFGWDRVAFLAGQTWDLFSPLTPTVENESVMWNAGNLGDRRPQMYVSYGPAPGDNGLSVAAGIGLTGAVDMLDCDGDGLREGEVSGRPGVQARAGYSRSLWVHGQPFSLGVSAQRGWLSTTRAFAGRSEFAAQGFNVDWTLPVTRQISVRGEGWSGRNLSDMRGGIAQSINLETGREIRSRGGWVEFKLRTSARLTVHPGFSVDDPLDKDLLCSGRTRNRVFYVANRVLMSEQFTIGLDFMRWRTDYRTASPGVDNRVNIHLQYSF